MTIGATRQLRARGALWPLLGGPRTPSAPVAVKKEYDNPLPCTNWPNYRGRSHDLKVCPGCAWRPGSNVLWHWQRHQSSNLLHPDCPDLLSPSLSWRLPDAALGQTAGLGQHRLSSQQPCARAMLFALVVQPTRARPNDILDDRQIPEYSRLYAGRLARTTVSIASLGPSSVSTTRMACSARSTVRRPLGRLPRRSTVRPAPTAASVTSLT